MNVTRRSFFKLASLLGLGFIVPPLAMDSTGPDTILGFPIKWVTPDEPKPLPTMLPLSSWEAEAYECSGCKLHILAPGMMPLRPRWVI